MSTPSAIQARIRERAFQELHRIGPLGYPDAMTDKMWRAIYAVDRALNHFSAHDLHLVADFTDSYAVQHGASPRRVLELPLVLALFRGEAT